MAGLFPFNKFIVGVLVVWEVFEIEVGSTVLNYGVVDQFSS